MTRVFITGIGAVTPFGDDFSTLQKGLLKGQSTAGKISLFDASDHKCQVACEVPDWDPTKHIDP